MRVVRTVAEARAARASLGRLGLVPTMGFLHEGHLGLVRAARADNEAVAASIFVNPTQFALGEDLDRYPRALERDLALLEREGVALAFVPEASEIYPPGFSIRIEPGPIAEPLEGRVRPGHFSGVATVVAKLFGILQPDSGYFGQKDAQQCAVVRQLARDLDLPVRIVIVPTVREPDGLALSSRNVYLDATQRAQAPVLYQALLAVRAAFEAGERDATVLRQAMRSALLTVPDGAIDYLSVASTRTLRELDQVEDSALASLAVRFGATRLLDNLVLGAR